MFYPICYPCKYKEMDIPISYYIKHIENVFNLNWFIKSKPSIFVEFFTGFGTNEWHKWDISQQKWVVLDEILNSKYEPLLSACMASWQSE